MRDGLAGVLQIGLHVAAPVLAGLGVFARFSCEPLDLLALVMQHHFAQVVREITRWHRSELRKVTPERDGARGRVRRGGQGVQEDDPPDEVRELWNHQPAFRAKVGQLEDRFSGTGIMDDRRGEMPRDGVWATLPDRGAEDEILRVQHRKKRGQQRARIEAHRHAGADAGVANRRIRHLREHAAAAKEGAIFRGVVRQSLAILRRKVQVVERGRNARITDMAGEGRPDARGSGIEPVQQFVSDFLQVERRLLEPCFEKSAKFATEHRLVGREVIPSDKIRRRKSALTIRKQVSRERIAPGKQGEPCSRSQRFRQFADHIIIHAAAQPSGPVEDDRIAIRTAGEARVERIEERKLNDRGIATAPFCERREIAPLLLLTRIQHATFDRPGERSECGAVIRIRGAIRDQEIRAAAVVAKIFREALERAPE